MRQHLKERDVKERSSRDSLEIGKQGAFENMTCRHCTTIHVVKEKKILHFEQNHFTSVNRLTSLANFPRTFRMEEKDIPHMVQGSFLKRLHGSAIENV